MSSQEFAAVALFLCGAQRPGCGFAPGGLCLMPQTWVVGRTSATARMLELDEGLSLSLLQPGVLFCLKHLASELTDTHWLLTIRSPLI